MYPPADQPPGPLAKFANFPRDAALQGPAQYVFLGEDQLEIDSIGSVSGVVLTISGVMLSERFELRPFSFTHTPSSNRSIVTTRVSIDSGWLEHLRIIVSTGAPIFGQVFVAARICRGGTSNALVLGTIATGYVTANTDVAWPEFENLLPLDGAGAPRSITVSNPAAGSEWSQVVPTGARWKIVAVVAQLVTSAAVATRSVRLFLDDGANVFFATPAAATQAAGATVAYSYGDGAGGPITADAAFIEAPLPNDCYLLGGFRIRSKTANIDVGDQYSLITLLVQEWQEGN